MAPADAAPTRRKEQIASAAVVGVSDVAFLGAGNRRLHADDADAGRSIGVHHAVPFEVLLDQSV
jgi:LmbE family N-acetylglucosaminyl deacetylase